MSTHLKQLPPHLARYSKVLDDPDAFAEALFQPLPQTLFTNGTRLTPGRLLELTDGALTLTPLAWRPGAFRLAVEDRPGRHWSFTSGLYTVQEEASLLPVAMLDVRPGHRVLDLCAAPGNKSAQMALALANRGTVIANDLKTGRLSAIHDLVRRLGLLNISTTGHDGCVYPVADQSFDRILVDAPCTAEGKARRGYIRDSSPSFRSWVRGQQRGLLRRALALLRPGGRLVYSTCTFAPEENEAVVADVLEHCNGEARLVPPGADLPGASSGLREWEGQSFPEALRHARRLWPHCTDTGGFFAAAIEKRGEAPDVHADTTSSHSVDTPAGLKAQFERFGFGTAVHEALGHLLDDRHLRGVARDHCPPPGVRLENCGLDLARRRARETKLSTPAAMALGQNAQQNVITLDAAEFARWRRREVISLPAARAKNCTRGTVLIRAFELVHGTAFLREGESGSWQLESQYPKSWMLGDLAQT
ncbi:MAG: RsmB/NOP family class I SAM-dependent RNA methyltransferase [Pseudomonadota bacterium]|nr:RsmB/NOP family class I SAM-dependent RNA methyltransferase [Pseudomonadota bacterium]